MGGDRAINRSASRKPWTFVSAACVLVVFYEIGFSILIDNEFLQVGEIKIISLRG